MDWPNIILATFFICSGIIVLVALGIIFYKIFFRLSGKIFSRKQALINIKKMPIAWILPMLIVIYLFSGYAKDLGFINQSSNSSLQLAIFSVSVFLVFDLFADLLANFNWNQWPEMFQPETPIKETGKKNFTVGGYFFGVISLSYLVWRMFSYNIFSELQLLIMILLVLLIVWHRIVRRKTQMESDEGTTDIFKHPLRHSKLFLIQIVFMVILLKYFFLLFKP